MCRNNLFYDLNELIVVIKSNKKILTFPIMICAFAMGAERWESGVCHLRTDLTCLTPCIPGALS